MSTIFPKRGRRQNTTDYGASESFVDLDAPPPISEKRHPSPFSYLRIRKRSTEGPKKDKTSPKDSPPVRRLASADSFHALHASDLDDAAKPLPPVPPFLNHNRNFSDPQPIYGALVYPQVPVRSPVRSDSSGSASLDPTPFPPTPPSHASQSNRYPTPAHWDAPSASEESILPLAHTLLPKPSPMLAAAAVMSAAESSSPKAFPSFSRDALGPETAGAAGLAAHFSGHGHGHGHGMHGVVQALEMDKAKVAATVGPLITNGLQNLTKAQTVVNDIVASEAWSVVKEEAQAVLAPAKDVVTILDSVVKYVPAIMVAESIFSVIIKHELERNENDKNILVVYHTMSVFWFTMCDLQAIFRADHEHIKSSLDTFFQGVSKTMKDFGNFRDVYYRHGHFSRTLRSSEYKKKLTGFATSFATHKADLHFILSESSALQINDMTANVDSVAASVSAMAAKLDAVIGALSRETPLEKAVAKEVENGGGEKALQDPTFLNKLAQSYFGGEEGVSAQVQANLKQSLDEALAANMPMYTLKVEAVQKEITEAVERSTEAILQQLNSGPYQLIKDEDIRTVWQGMNWRISCKARHFVDAVHNHFAQKFGEHQQTSGDTHSDQWTLNVLSQVIYYPNISDAIDDDGSGYISVQEVNQFFKSRPREWSAPQWLAYWAAGWKQNALAYKDRCKTLFAHIEATARTVHPDNRRAVKAYIKTSGLSELWLVVNSVTPDGLGHRSAHQTAETEPLNALRAEMMHKETQHFKSRLEGIRYQLESPETTLAVLGTHRLEGFILCLLELILDRHWRVLDAANTLVIGEREFDTMTLSLKNLVTAFGRRYRTLTESWKQQRLDPRFLVQCFAGGIFNDWHAVFEDQPHAYVVEPAVLSPLKPPSGETTEHSKSPNPRDILIFPLPAQPTSAASAAPVSPPHRLAPPRVPQGPRRRSMNNRTSDYFFHFDFERLASERPASVVDPASISEVYSKKTKKPKLEDRITSLETELSDIKSMLNKLILLSTPSSEQ